MIAESLPGVVCVQFVRCGRLCRCATGKGHEAFYRFWREDGKLRKVYIRRGDLERVRAACARRLRDEAWIKRLVTGPDAQSVKREIRATLRAALGDNGGDGLIRRLSR
jgi:hypothetical protein